MDSLELKKLQTPLKEKYRNDPQTAIITLRAEGKVGEDLSCKVSTGRSIIEAGLHPATGGTGLQLCSGDMLLEALVACAGVTLNAVATAMNIILKSAVVKAEGDINFAGTLGVLKDAPVGFFAIRLFFILDTDAEEGQLQKLKELTERYCVVYQTLTKGVSIESAFIDY